jgi:HK97 family phage prohead protease
MEDVMDIERRTLGGLEIRSAEGAAPSIEGYAAVFNSMSPDLGGFREVILPGAFDRAMRESHDVRALVNHDSNQILGRTKSGTLALAVDSHGLQARISPPDTEVGRSVVTSIKRGDLDGMSFAFYTVTDNWRTENGEQIREVADLELLDVSVVAYPAYPATQVSARALDHVKAAAETKAREDAETAREAAEAAERDALAARAVLEARQRLGEL